ncbi:hypothetical protein JW711_01395 [Candidatus Woesearchaeota archaeon]|nr:hypothetical protein [Candidatus Woesearchaeota archaeon]
MSATIEIPLNEIFSADQLRAVCRIDDLKDQYGKTYQFIRRKSAPKGTIFHKDVALKVYHMLRETEPLPPNLTAGLESFLRSEIEKKSAIAKQGAGFAILSQGFLSINMWGRGNVLFTQTYTVEANPPNLTREPLEKTGVACTWEARIMGFEYELWHRYLTSPQGAHDKKKYLTEFIEGDL